MSKKRARKVAKAVVMAMVVMLTMQNTSQVANAAVTAAGVSKRTQYVVSNADEFIEIGNNSVNQQVKLTKGKTYIFSYPIFNKSGLKFTSVEYCTKDGSWKSIDLLTMFGGNEELIAHVCQYGPGKMMLKLICMSNDISKFKTQIKDEHTGEIYEFLTGVEVQEPQIINQNEQERVANDQTDETRDVSRPSETIPNNPSDKPAEDSKPGEGSDDIIIIVPPEEPDEDPEIIIIDTSNWKFSQVSGTYNGKEFAAIVEGIPEELKDIVKVEYINNTRTNAGEQTAYVKFTVPEGYQIINGMETQINIDKAKYEASLGKRSVEYFSDGSMRFKIPSVDIPDEIKATYTVNGVEQNDSSVIRDSGVYVVEAKFESENYEVEDVKTVYYVDPPIFGNNTEYKLHLDRMTAEPTDENGHIKVMIWMECNDNFSLGLMQYAIRYDGKVLKYISAEKGNGMSHAGQNPYSEEDGQIGTGSTIGSISNHRELVTLTFELLDPNAKDVALNLTDIFGKPSMLDSTKYETYGAGIHLLQQSDTKTEKVYLPQPYKQVQKSENKVSQNSLTAEIPVVEMSKADETKTEEISGVVNDITMAEECPIDEVQSEVQESDQQIDDDVLDTEKIDESEAEGGNEVVEDIKETGDEEQNDENGDNNKQDVEDNLKSSDSTYVSNQNGDATDKIIVNNGSNEKTIVSNENSDANYESEIIDISEDSNGENESTE